MADEDASPISARSTWGSDSVNFKSGGASPSRRTHKRTLRKSLRKIHLAKNVCGNDASRADEFMTSGIIADIVVREYNVMARKYRILERSSEDMYRWYRKTYARPNEWEKAAAMHRLKSASLDEDAEENITLAARVAKTAELTRRLETCIHSFWVMREKDQPAVRKDRAAAEGFRADETPIQKLRRVALNVYEGRLEVKRLYTAVTDCIHDAMSRSDVSKILSRESPDTVSENNRAFWSYYHRNATRLEGATSMIASGDQAAKPTSKDIRKKPLHDATKTFLPSLGHSPVEEFAADSFGALSRSPGSGWALDRHAKAARATFAHSLTKRHRVPGRTLPSIAHGVRAAAATYDRHCAEREMQHLSRCASVPGVRALEGVQCAMGKVLPPVCLGGLVSPAPRPQSLKLDVSAHAAMSRYVKSIHNGSVIPMSTALPMAQQRSIVASGGEILTDHDLQALASMIPHMSRLEAVELQGSGLLTDLSVVPLLRRLFGPPARDSLTRLCISGCTRVGRTAIETIVKLLADPDGLPKVAHLDLGGVEIPSLYVGSFCEAARDHPCLESLRLANCTMGTHTSAPHYLSVLLQSPRIEVLDLSWNCFNAELFQIIGQGVCENVHLRELYLESATASRSGVGDSPITSFLECLARERTLRLLDIGNNLIDCEAAIVMEDSLARHENLTELRVSNNPLGPAGMRSFLRLFFNEATPALVRFECENCFSSQVDGRPGFNLSNPSAKYELDLVKPRHRSILRMLYKSCERFGLAPEKAFCDVTYSEGSMPHPSAKDASGIWPVPEEGTLTFVFTIDGLFGQPGWIGDAPSKVAPSLAATRFATEFRRRFWVHPSMAKMAPVVAYWQRLSGQSAEQELLLTAISDDIALSLTHLQVFCASTSDMCSITMPDIISRLHHAMGRQTERTQAYFMLPRLSEYVSLEYRCGNYLAFNLEHATGRYNLQLSNAADRHVAASVILLDRWEAATAQRQGRADTSMHGNWSNVRNCVFGSHLNIRLINEWQLQCHDSLRFDYVSWRRPPAKAVPMSESHWMKLLERLTYSGCAFADKLAALRKTVHQMYARSVQVREMLGLFNQHERIEILILMFHRTMDPENLKLVHARIASAEEWEAAYARLGTLACLPYVQPEGHKFKLDLGTYEGRLATSIIVQLAFKERVECIRNPEFLQPDGTPSEFSAGIPPQWVSLANVPEGGDFTFTYLASPEERRLGPRKEAFKTYGGWQREFEEDSVSWWTSLSECPEELIQFIYHLMRDFPSPETFFRGLVGRGGAKASVHRYLFEQEVLRQEWKMFKDPELVRQVFRALDVDNDGDVSLLQWGSVVQLWNELQLSALELLRQMQRFFAGDFDRAWRELDADYNGKIDLDEWNEACRMIGYFGPTLAIFHLFTDGQPTIGKEGWAKLRGTWENRAALYDGISRAIRGEAKPVSR